MQYLQKNLFLLLLLALPAMTIKLDVNQNSNLDQQGDFELRLAVTEWFIQNEEKLVGMNEMCLKDEFNEFIFSQGFSDKSKQELENTLNLVKSFQKKIKESFNRKGIKSTRLQKKNKELGVKGTKPFRFNQWSG